MPLPPLSLLVLDTETTGFVPGVHRVIEYACSVIEKGKVVSEYEQLIAAEENSIPPHVQVMTHIHPEDLTDEPTFGEIVETLQAMIKPGMIVVGQNIKYDIGMLRGEGWDLSDLPTIDTAMLASVVFPEIKSYSLSYVSAVLGLPHQPKHRALGDVHATTALLGKCWERLLMLPAEDRGKIAALAAKAPIGLRSLFEVLAQAPTTERKRPAWLGFVRERSPSVPGSPMAVPVPAEHGVHLLPEPLSPNFLSSVLVAAPAGTWVAVKNIDACLRRLGSMPENAVALSSPDFLLSKSAADAFLQQKEFTSDELTLACKLLLYEPANKSEVPIHGEEYQIWTGKLACGRASPEYRRLLDATKTKAVLLTHHELLGLLTSDSGLPPNAKHIVIDDASMLEDTATYALGWTCQIPVIRAAAQGNELLMQLTDLVELWVEKTRLNLDLKYFTETDLQTREASQVRRLLVDLGDNLAALPPSPRQAFAHLAFILDPGNLAGRIAWMETGMDGSKSLRSVPADIAALLRDILYTKVPVTLCVPPGGSEQYRAFLSADIDAAPIDLPRFPPPPVSLTTPMGVRIDDILTSPVGKTVLLVSSKRTIEDVYVQHAEEAEAAGVTLLCQGFNGGQSRMQAEFALAAAPAVMVMTPWTYETVELPAGSVDRLVVQTLPFDHPNHPVVSKRGNRYKSSFADYALPRLQHRLFRLLRTFLRHGREGASIAVLDERLHTKPYGKDVLAYLQGLIPAAGGTPKKEGQMELL